MAGGTMTKAELVEEVSRVSDLTKKHSEVIVDTVFKSIITALQRGEKIELRGFGSFRLRQREPRKGRNPKTGDKVDVPPKKVPYFKPGKELKELINKEAEAGRLSRDLQRLQREFREDLNLRKNEELSQVLERANKVIQEIAEKEKYDLILQEAVYRSPRIDITEKVLKALSDK